MWEATVDTDKSSAQRLPASKNESLDNLRKRLGPNEMCSTPSGIKGTIAMENLLQSSNRICAQRLPASKEQSHGGRCDAPNNGCAQRLPASKEQSRVRLCERSRSANVLNAF